MNTERSKRKAADFLERGNIRKRTIREIRKTFDFPPEEVFHQFCPARELDWIDGWDCNLVYTATGYVEADCIFTTDRSNPLGPSLWVFTRYEPNQRLELVRIVEDAMVVHFRIRVDDHRDGTCTGNWHLTFTALNETGDAMVESIPESIPELARAIDGLDHFLLTGELMTA